MAAIFKALHSDLLKKELVAAFINFKILAMRVIFHSALSLTALFATEAQAVNLNHL